MTTIGNKLDVGGISNNDNTNVSTPKKTLKKQMEENIGNFLKVGATTAQAAMNIVKGDSMVTEGSHTGVSAFQS